MVEGHRVRLVEFCAAVGATVTELAQKLLDVISRVFD
jgi:hypothetical protein